MRARRVGPAVMAGACLAGLVLVTAGALWIGARLLGAVLHWAAIILTIID